MSTERNIMEQVLAGAERIRKAPKKTPVQDGVVLVCGDSLTPQPISWLWPDWLALGKLHVLAGAPGQGKTTIFLSFAAAVTTGTAWPDGTRCHLAGNVLIWSGEDDAADTLLPRLIAAGADRNRVYFVSGTRIEGEVCPFDPARDMPDLKAAAERIGNVRLILVDPIASAVVGDSHKNTEVRRALQPLVDLAAGMNAALVGITHFSKNGQGMDPAQRVIGSVAFTAVARVVLVAAKVQGDDGEDRRILARGKSNIGPDDGGLTYALEQVEALPGIYASRIVWGVQVQGTARELLAEPSDRETESPRAEAAEFLRQVLAAGPAPASVIKTEAQAAGISWITVRRAADDLAIIKRKGGMDAGWYWSLPTLPKVLSEAPKVIEEVQPSRLSTFEHLRDDGITFGEGSDHE